MKNSARFVVAFTLMVLPLGCGGGAGDDNRPERVAVSGVVTLDGTPVSGATVTFNGRGETPGAVGKSDSEGKFVMSTYGNGDGVVPGTFSVSVTKFQSAAVPNIPSEDDPNYDGDESEVIEDEDPEDGPVRRRKRQGPVNELPAAYGDADNGLLSVKIDEATTDVKLELSSSAEE